MLRDHGVGAGCIDNVEIAQKTDWQVAFDQVLGDFDRSFLLAITEDTNAVCCRKNIDFGKRFSKECVQERRFSGFHFAHSDDEQRLANIGE